MNSAYNFNLYIKDNLQEELKEAEVTLSIDSFLPFFLSLKIFAKTIGL
jgi:hypothetical protein